MPYFTLSNVLSIIVIVVILIDIAYRVKYRLPIETVKPKGDTALKEIFRDFRPQLSFTRTATAVVILFIFAAIAIGLYWPHLQTYCTTAYDKLIDFAKMLFGIGKTPEAVGQLNGLLKGPQPPAPTPIIDNAPDSDKEGDG